MNTANLLPWQPAAAQHLFEVLQRNGAAVDGSDGGVGKTFVAGAIIRELNVPTLVVGPRPSKTQWFNMGKALGAEFDYINYEMVRTGRTPYGKWAVDGKFVWAPEIHALVFDEIHRCNAIKSLNSDMVIAAKEQRIFTLGLSATLGETPGHFKALGYLLGLHCLEDQKIDALRVRPGFVRWAKKRGCYDLRFYGDDEFKRTTMAAIHNDIFPARGVRVRVKDLGDAFPECQITAELYDMGDEAAIDKLWEEMGEAMAALKTKMAFDKCPNHPMTRLVRARQQVELLKVPTFVSLTQDALAQGYSVVLFVSYTQTLDELCKRLDIKCRIDGSQVGPKGEQERQGMLDLFQSNKEHILAANEGAGSESLSMHDLHGGHPRIGFVSPGWSARRLRQVFFRLPRAESKSKSLYRVLLAAGTVEERIHRNLSSKLNQLDALMDADLDAANLSVS